MFIQNIPTASFLFQKYFLSKIVFNYIIKNITLHTVSTSSILDGS